MTSNSCRDASSMVPHNFPRLCLSMCFYALLSPFVAFATGMEYVGGIVNLGGSESFMFDVHRTIQKKHTDMRV
jgi:hypothetical protein